MVWPSGRREKRHLGRRSPPLALVCGPRGWSQRPARAEGSGPAIDSKSPDEFQPNYCIPAELKQRFEVLNVKSQSSILTAEEHAEMLQLIDQLEQKHAERLEKLLDLAQLRGVPLKTLMQDLQLVQHA